MSRFEVALAGVLLVAGTARALDITSCGVLVPPGEIGDPAGRSLLSCHLGVLRP